MFINLLFPVLRILTYLARLPLTYCPLSSILPPRKMRRGMKKLSLVLLGSIGLFCLILSQECYADAYAYITNYADDTVSLMRVGDNTVAVTIPVGDGPWGVAVTPRGDYVHVTNSLGNTVSVISTYYNTVAATIDVGGGPSGVAVTPSGDYVYVANHLDSSVSVISASSVTATIDVGGGPSGVAVTPSGDYVYVANNSDATVSVIDTSDNSVTATIDVGGGPWGVAVNNSNDYAYVANNWDNTISVIDTSDNSVTATISVGNLPVAFGRFIGGKAPEAPGDLVATAVSDSQIDLSWTDNSNDELGFKIERKLYGETFTEIATVTHNVTSYSDTGLDYYRTYYYRVTAYNDAGDSDYSNEADATTEDVEDGCFIATAAYGSLMKLCAKILRDLRDHLLPTNF
jgi:YVTN family beta-propeller protein